MCFPQNEQAEKDRQKNCKSEKKSALKAERTPFYKLILNVTTQRYEYQVQGAHWEPSSKRWLSPYVKKKNIKGTSLVVWWLRLPLPSNSGSAVSVLGQGAKIPHAPWPKKKKSINRKNIVRNLIKTIKTLKGKKRKRRWESGLGAGTKDLQIQI